MPAYRMVLDDPRWKVSDVLNDLLVEVGPDWTVPAWVKSIEMDGVTVLLIGSDSYFQDAHDSASIYSPGIDPYLFFSHAVLDVAKKLNLAPDVIHCNDWHTGLIPVLMREKKFNELSRTASVFTIHNLAYQGEFDRDLLDRMGLPQRLFNAHQLETWGRLNFLKSGCVYADHVTTVSPTYAEEIQTPEFGCTLEGLMKYLAANGRLTGILNGIDQDSFNPEIDPALPANFTAEDLSGKFTCKARLLSELKLPVRPSTPLLGIVSRLSEQKGLHMVADLIPLFTKLPAQLVIQGLGDPAIATRLRELAAKYPKTFRFVEEFDADLAQRIYAGADMFLMPSAFEPCGLGQMIAMRYGTVPVVRKTGGLADTVFDGKNGFVFEEMEAADLWQALLRAQEEYRRLADWGHFINAGMASDHSWTESASSYELLYKKCQKSNGGAARKAASA